MLRVSDLEKSIKYYEDCIGMQLLRKRENPGAATAPPSSQSTGCNSQEGTSELPTVAAHAVTHVLLLDHLSLMSASSPLFLSIVSSAAQIGVVWLQSTSTRWRS